MGIGFGSKLYTLNGVHGLRFYTVPRETTSELSTTFHCVLFTEQREDLHPVSPCDVEV